MRERETKVLVSPGFRLPFLDGFGALDREVMLTADDVVEQRATYYDTPDLRLTHSGASLRYRSDDQWTVKIPDTNERDLLVRSEVSFAGNPDSPPPAAVELLRGWIRTSTIEPVAHVTTRRHRLVLTDRGGAKVAEIDDDHVRTSARGASVTTFREIEIELDETTPSRIGRRLTDQLRHAGATKTSTVPKVARALGLREVGRRADTGIGRDASVGDFTRAAIRTSVQRLLAFDPVIRIGEDPEGVHQARVATRRLRSDLRTLRPLLNPDWTDALRDELRWLGAALGKVRDADVLHDLLVAKSATGPVMNDLLARQSMHARAELLRVMSSGRYAALLDRLVDAQHRPALITDETRPARDLVVDLAGRTWRRFRHAVRALPRHPPDAALHDVRRRAKQARYAFEAITPLGVRGAQSRAEAAELVQQLLGDNQDRVIARQWLHDAAADEPERAFLAGELAGNLEVEQLGIRARAHHALRKIR